MLRQQIVLLCPLQAKLSGIIRVVYASRSCDFVNVFFATGLQVPRPSGLGLSTEVYIAELSVTVEVTT